MAVQSLTALALASASASVSGGDIGNTSADGAVFVVDITAIAGTTPTAVFTIEGKDPLSGKYYTILASASLSAVSTTVLRVHPAMTPAANLTASDMMPSVFRVRATIGGTTPDVTATVGVIKNG
jgi:hypothetical protein